MRLIDADDAIRKMESAMDMQDLYLPIHFKEVIDEVPTIEERKEKWIPCSVEKPKKTGYYICTCHDGVCYRTSVLVWSTGWVLTGVRAYWRVIAWMPLPNPWKGEKDETD